MTDDKQIARELIDAMRKDIDDIDQSIINLVRLRTEKSAQIARLKRKNKIPIVDGQREMTIFSRYSRALGQLGKTMASALLSKNKELPEPDNTDSEE